MSNSYDNESIRAMSTRDSFRLKPDVWLQGHDLNAVKHTLVEVVGNAIDEVKYCVSKGLPCTPRIDVKRYADHAMSVQDYGRGIPVDFNQSENEYNFKLIFMTPFAGGKYDDEGAYMDGFTVGTNGVGLTVTQYTADYMDAIIRRDNTEYRVRFEDGYLIGDMTKEPAQTVGSEQSGSFIKWKPSNEVFTDTVIEDDYFEQLLKGMAIASGITITFTDEITGVSLTFQGVDYTEYFNSTVKCMSLTETFSKSGVVSDTKDVNDNYRYEFEGIVAFTEKPSKLFMYHNLVSVMGGIHYDSVLTGLSRAMRRTLDYSISCTKEDCRHLMDFVSVFMLTRSNKTSYDGQAKRSVLNRGLASELTSELVDIFEKLLAKSPDTKNYLIKLLKHKKKSEEDLYKLERNAAKIRKVQEKVYQEDLDPEKFVDCRGFDGAELYIVEGDSAMGSCKHARNADFQAITAVRGKIINCLKQDMATIARNEIVIRLLRILGEKTTIPTLRVPQSSKKWDKIIICTDADEDGFQIRTLLVTFFYVIFPHLLEEGRVYIVESPLFEINTAEGILYAYSVEEKDNIIKDFEQRGVGVKSVQRSKGLGENDPEMMWTTTMNPDTRKLIQVVYDPNDDFASLTEQMFSALLGEDIETRKEFIMDYMSNNPLSLESVI